MRTHPGTINIITLGCAKNLVDSEVLMAQLKTAGYSIVHNSNDLSADTVIINTCGFIRDAKEESIDMILQVCNAREDGLVKNVFVMGCLSERYRDDLREELPEVDRFFGVRDMEGIVSELGGTFRKDLVGERLLTTPSHYAYLKISEGCDRQCSFCAIPLIRGKQVSRPVEDIVREAAYLVSAGVREIILIAQDLTAYGTDLYRKRKLAFLLSELEKVKGLDWIRLHYTYPAAFPLDVLKMMAASEKICKYIDIPFQHISDSILKRMKRGIDSAETYELIRKMREIIPGIALRTSLLVGYPGETVHDFEQLKEFVATTRFDRLGVFVYSEEEGTFAALNEKDTVSEELKTERYNELMELQSGISLKINHSRIGSILPVILDRREEDNFIGRTEYDSPEVDNEVIVNPGKSELKTGEIVNVRISGAEEYDLYGDPVYQDPWPLKLK